MLLQLMTRLQEENKRLSATVAETKQQLDEHKANRKLQEDHMAQLMQQAVKKRAQASSSAGQEQPSRYTSTEADPGTGPALDPLVTINSGYGRALRVRTNLEEVALELESWIEHFQAVIAVVAEVVTPQPHARALHQQQQQQQAAEDEAAEYDSHQGGRGGRGSYLQSGRVDAGRSSGNVRHLATWQAMSKAFRREMDEQLERYVLVQAAGGVSFVSPCTFHPLRTRVQLTHADIRLGCACGWCVQHRWECRQYSRTLHRH